MRRRLAAALAAGTLMVVVAAGSASAAGQIIDATLGSSVSMTTSPSATVSGWILAPSGANTTSGGSMTISSNAPYTATVTADKAGLSEYVSGAYVSSGKQLTSPLSVVPTRSAGNALVPGVATTAIVGTSTLLGTGTGLGTDTYTLSLSQPTLISDSALASGSTYHIVLTYTASSTI
jgi:hypothetical protein